MSEQIGARLKSLRQQLGFSTEEMDNHFGITVNSYRKNESGYSAPSFQSMLLLTTDFDVSMDWLLLNKGPLFYKDKNRGEDLEKKIVDMEKQVIGMEKEITELKQNLDSAQKKVDELELPAELKELLDSMKQSTLFRYEILAFSQRLKKEM